MKQSKKLLSLILAANQNGEYLGSLINGLE